MSEELALARARAKAKLRLKQQQAPEEPSAIGEFAEDVADLGLGTLGVAGKVFDYAPGLTRTAIQKGVDVVTGGDEAGSAIDAAMANAQGFGEYYKKKGLPEMGSFEIPVPTDYLREKLGEKLNLTGRDILGLASDVAADPVVLGSMIAAPFTGGASAAVGAPAALLKIGKVLQKVTPITAVEGLAKSAPALRSSAEMASAKSLGATKALINKYGKPKIQELGATALDTGIVTPFASTEEKLSRATKLGKESMNQRDAIYNLLDEAGIKEYDPAALKQALIASRAPEYGTTLGKEYTKTWDDLMKTIDEMAPVTKEVPMQPEFIPVTKTGAQFGMEATPVTRMTDVPAGGAVPVQGQLELFNDPYLQNLVDTPRTRLEPQGKIDLPDETLLDEFKLQKVPRKTQEENLAKYYDQKKAFEEKGRWKLKPDESLLEEVKIVPKSSSELDASLLKFLKQKETFDNLNTIRERSKLARLGEGKQQDLLAGTTNELPFQTPKQSMTTTTPAIYGVDELMDPFYQVQDVLDLVPKGGTGLSVGKEGQQLQSVLDSLANWNKSKLNETSAVEKLARSASRVNRDILNKTAESSAKKIGKADEAALIAKQNKLYEQTNKMKKLLGNKLAAEEGNKSLGLTDWLSLASSVAGGSAVGGPLGAVIVPALTLGAKKGAEAYGKSSQAALLNYLSKKVANNETALKELARKGKKLPPALVGQILMGPEGEE